MARRGHTRYGQVRQRWNGRGVAQVALWLLLACMALGACSEDADVSTRSEQRIPRGSLVDLTTTTAVGGQGNSTTTTTPLGSEQLPASTDDPRIDPAASGVAGGNPFGASQGSSPNPTATEPAMGAGAVDPGIGPRPTPNRPSGGAASPSGSGTPLSPSTSTPNTVSPTTTTPPSFDPRGKPQIYNIVVVPDTTGFTVTYSIQWGNGGAGTCINALWGTVCGWFRVPLVGTASGSSATIQFSVANSIGDTPGQVTGRSLPFCAGGCEFAYVTSVPAFVAPSWTSTQNGVVSGVVTIVCQTNGSAYPWDGWNLNGIQGIGTTYNKLIDGRYVPHRWSTVNFHEWQDGFDDRIPRC